jgi:serine/threonine protein phosphatase PrpC
MEELQLKHYRIQYYQFSEIGKRNTNQDKVSAIRISDQSSLFLVADGMGGYSFGDLAAELIVNELNRKISEEINEVTDEEVINNAVTSANEVITILISEKEAESGATLGGILFKDFRYTIFWVGDVKLVIYRNGEVSFTSSSHTLENEFKMNRNRKEDYINSSVRHIVTRSICGKDKIYSPEIKSFELKLGDKVLLASDGFYELFNDNEIARFIKHKINWDEFIQDVLSNKLKSANDNASGILINIY